MVTASTAARTDGLPAPILTELRAILGPDGIRTRPADLLPYARDATPLAHGKPDVVVFPRRTDEIAAVLRVAARHRIPVIARGSGTSLCAGTVPEHGGIVLVTTRMDQVLELDPAHLLARVQPGVRTAVLAEQARHHGLLYAPDPGSHQVSTIGGNIATGAGGLRGLKYGVTRHHVLGLTVVLADGEVIQTGGRLNKDVAGYDLTRLLVGSEGTLGVIAEATVALMPQPRASATGVAYFSTLAQAGLTVGAIVASGILPATLEFLDHTCISAVEDFAQLGLRRDAGALLLFGDDGDPRTVSDHLAAMAGICERHGALEVTVAQEVAEAEALLAARRCCLPALSRRGSLTILEDASVPRGEIPRMVSDIEQIARRFRLRIGTFGHAGDGNLHPTCVLDVNDHDGIERAHRAFDEIFARALELGGTITGEHGIGRTKRDQLPRQLGAAQIALLRRIKLAFDPLDILNPGKLGSC